MNTGRARAGTGRVRPGEIWLVGALLGLAALAWALTVEGARAMGNGPGTMGQGPGGFVLLWTIMMAAMMLPAVAPVATVYLRAIASRSSGVTRGLRTGSLVAGYLGVWAATGLLAFAAAWGGSHLARQTPGAASWVAAAVLAAAGLYQLTPFKDRCLRHCRSPLGQLLHLGSYSGRFRDLRAGLYHGGYCLGCCWALMAVLIPVGVMNLAWMVGLSLVVFAEKTWRRGRVLGIAFGLGLVAFACLVPWHPGLVPGLHLGAGMRMG